MAITYDDKTGELTVNEYELHGIIAGLRHLACPDCDDENKQGIPVTNSVKIVPDDKDEFNEDMIEKWQNKMSELLSYCGKIDSEFHEDAEYTC